MNKSEQINELATALAKAQSQFQPVTKTGLNPHLKNRYVTLDGIIEAIKGPLGENGIAYSQLVGTSYDEHGGHQATLTTMLMHSSGQWMSTTAVIDGMEGHRGVNAMQAFGSSLTYMKRYALAAILGVSSDEDDDGNSSSTRRPAQKEKAEPQSQQQGATMKQLWARWGELWNDGKNLGLEIESLPANVSREELIERGKALKAAIEAAKGQPAVEWPAQVVAAVIKDGLTEDTHSAANTLKYAIMPRNTDKETVLGWFRVYRAGRDGDGSVADAAANANAWFTGGEQ
jgi:hypothetical protein